MDRKSTPKKPANLQRLDLTLLPDKSRVLLRPYNLPVGKPDPFPMSNHIVESHPRAVNIMARVLSLSETEVNKLVEDLFEEFSDRHREIESYLLRRAEQLKRYIPTDQKLTHNRMLLIGSLFVSEYSLESAALFNPSIVPHPDQSGLPAGSLRFVLSLRAVGEGHISSVLFRTGTIDKDINIRIQRASRYVTEPKTSPHTTYEKELFERKLYELGLSGEFTSRVLSLLSEKFTLDELRSSLEQNIKHPVPKTEKQKLEYLAHGMWVLAISNYEVQFDKDQKLSERVIFPNSPSQSNGIEDARFVRFRKDDGTFVYYATYTAYDGKLILPQLLMTDDFLRFRFNTLNGPAVRNKGMALFPRKIHGLYAMLSRQDNENIYLMFSDNVHFWYKAEVIMKPVFPWEFVQLGNCGSPIELDEGWLVLSHGVGPMRKYCIGAFLLDKKNPQKVIGRTSEPLLKPDENEREGYVPNVVYSCGALVHNNYLILPYAMSDYATRFAIAPIKDILNAMI